MQDYEEDYEEEANREEAEVVIEAQFNEKLKFEVPISLEVGHYVKAAIDKLVEQKLNQAVLKYIDQQLEARINLALDNEIELIAATAMDTKIKTFDYSGNVKDEKTIQDLVREKMAEVNAKGLNYQLTVSEDSYNKKTKTIASIIEDDIYTVVKLKLKPQFEAIEKDFTSKSQEALRQFAVAAVNNSTSNILKGLN